MRQLLRKPLLLAFILSVPLWIVFNNYIVALSVALLVAFLLSMLETMVALRREARKQPDTHGRQDTSDPLPDTFSGSLLDTSSGSSPDPSTGSSSGPSFDPSDPSSKPSSDSSSNSTFPR